MILNPSAVAMAKQVFLTGEDVFLAAMESGFTTPNGLAKLAPTLTGILERSAQETGEIIFQNLLRTAPDFISGGGSALSASTEGVAESLALSATRNATLELAAGGTAGTAGATLTRTILEAGARGIVIGLVIAAVEYAFNRVARWRAEIAIGRAHSAIQIALTNVLLDAYRESNPLENPWPAPWPKPGTRALPESEETRRKKRHGAKRYRRMQRRRGR